MLHRDALGGVIRNVHGPRWSADAHAQARSRSLMKNGMISRYAWKKGSLSTMRSFSQGNP